MELGSGLGLGGLAAAHAAAAVTLTDRREEVLRTLHCSADINSTTLPESFRCEQCAEQVLLHLCRIAVLVEHGTQSRAFFTSTGTHWKG